MDTPVEIFLSLIAFTFAMGIVGLWKKIPIMLFIAGAVITFWSVMTDNIVIDSFIDGQSDSMTVYEVLSRTGQDDIRTGYGEIQAQYVSTSSSQLINDVVNCATWHIKKSGSPDSNTIIRYGVWDNSATPMLKYTFGTLNVTNLGTTVQPVKLCNTTTDYTIVQNDRIGIAWNDGNATSRLTIDVDATNPYDSTITYNTRFNGASWVANTGTDMQGKLSLEGEASLIVYDTFEFTEYPKILFGIIGAIIMLAGAMIWKYEEN